MARKAAAILEVLALLLLCLICGRWLQAYADLEIPEPVSALVFQWLPLIVFAWIIDRTVRQRRPQSWGFEAKIPVIELGRTTARLLFLGGLLPLCVAALGREPMPLPENIPILLAGLAAPLLGQEVYLAGFGQRRLSDAFRPLGVAILVALFFIFAHLGHLGQGLAGMVFVLLMAWQGLLWSAARSAGMGIYPLLAAHLLLLLCYMAPRIGLPVVVAAGLIGLPGLRAWSGKLWSAVARPNAAAMPQPA